MVEGRKFRTTGPEAVTGWYREAGGEVKSRADQLDAIATALVHNKAGTRRQWEI